MDKKGFSLIELMLAVVVLTTAVGGLLMAYMGCFELNQLARNFTLANNACQAELESLKNVDFDDLDGHNGGTFEVSGFSPNQSRGRIEVTSTTYKDLKYIRVIACWRQKGGRIVGEDRDLDGWWPDLGEDINGNGRLDSPVELISFISR